MLTQLTAAAEDVMNICERYPLHLSDASDSDCDISVQSELSRKNAGDCKTSDTVSCTEPDTLHEDSQDTDSREEQLSQRRRNLAEHLSRADSCPVSGASVLRPGFNQARQLPADGRRRERRRLARLRHQRTAGSGWYDMPAPEMTDELRQNVDVIRMRAALDRSRVYKRSDMRTTPKYFAMGTVVEHAADFYSSRLTRKQRKTSLVDELMADADARQRLKRQAAKLHVKKKVLAQSVSAVKRTKLVRRKRQKHKT